MTDGLLKRGSLDTDMHTGTTPGDIKSINGDDAPNTRGIPKNVSRPPEAGREAA